jgi:tight adherence protein B
MVSRRSAIAAVGLGLLVITLAPAVRAGEPAGFDFVDTSDFPTVRVVITPAAGGGGLVADDVTVLQDGEAVPATVTPLQSDPIEAVLLIDTSGSMAGAPIAAAKQAAVDFISALPPGSSVAVLGFGDEVQVVAGLAAPSDETTAGITGLRAQGETALYDAVLAAAGALASDSSTRRFIVLLSDGGDTASEASLDDVTAGLSAITLGFYAIQLEGSEVDSAALSAIADAGSGRFVPAADSEGLAAIYAEIAAEVASQYAVGFEVRHGGSSAIEVVVEGESGIERFAADLDLPDLPAPGSTPVVTLVPPAVRTITPAPISIVGGPSALQQHWVLTVGVGFLALTLLIVFTYALQPSTGGPRRSVILPGPADGTRRRKGLSRLFRRREGVRDGEEFVPRRRRARSGIEAALETAGIDLRGSEYLALVAVASFIGLGIGLASGSPMLGLLLLAAAVAVPRLWVSRAAQRRHNAFADQLEGTLQLMASTLRAGYGLSQAVATVAEEAPSPTREEFARIVVETRIGRDLPGSLRALAERMKNEDFGWIADAMAIQQEVGGNLAEILDAVGGTIRDRNQIRRQVHALSAEGRMSAVVLIALPIGLAGIISTVNPGYLDVLFNTGGGRVLLLAGVVLMTFGVIWIRKLVKIRF